MAFTVMTFNLRYANNHDGVNAWSNRVHKVVRTLAAHDPLVVGTQETTPVMLENLDQELRAYARVGRGRNEGGLGEHCAIYYKKDELAVEDQGQFWLSEEPEREGSIGWDALCPRICTWAHFRFRHRPEKQFIHYNTHLDHVGKVARQQGIRLIWQAIRRRWDAAALPFVLTGDFNSHPDSEVVQFLEDEALDAEGRFKATNAYSVLDHPPGRTAHKFEGGASGEPIDYIFVSPQFRLLDVHIDRRTVDGGYPSDHYPVAARIDWMM